MLQKPNSANSATDLKSELDRLHNNVPVFKPHESQPPDRTDHLNNVSSREQQHQQLNQIYQRYQQQHHHNQQRQHSEPQHPKEEAKIVKPKNSQSLTPSSQHFKTSTMQLNNAANHHNHNQYLHHHNQIYQKTGQHLAGSNGFATAGHQVVSSNPTVDQLLLQNHPTTHSTSQNRVSKLTSDHHHHHHHHHHHQHASDSRNISTGVREGQPLYTGIDKQPLPINHPSSFTKNHLTSQQMLENDLGHKSGHSSSNSRQEQQERETNELFAIDSQLDNLELGDFNREGAREGEEEEEVEVESKESDTLNSLEKNLPVELSFLIRQQAYCAAKMNYLERQIRELKEICQANTAFNNKNHNYATQTKYCGISRLGSNNNHTTVAAKLNAHGKNGNFIPSDDSGGEYSRATFSDDDELSSLLDQIAKSIRPDRCQSMRNSSQFQQQQHELQQHLHYQQYLQQQQQHLHQPIINSRVNYGVYGSSQQQAPPPPPLPPQRYTLIDSSQLHHQALPVFVMSSPITVAPHPSSINSSVYYQSEPRYNQYYEDFYLQQQQHQQNKNNPSTSTPYSQNAIRSRQLDGNLMAGSAMTEQLTSVTSQQLREKRQIKSQLKSNDNWLKTRSSNLCNMRGSTTNQSNDKNCDGISSRQQQVPLVGDTSETGNQVLATGQPPTTVTLATVAPTMKISEESFATHNATTTTTTPSSAEAASSSSTATEVENVNSVIEDSKR